MNTFIAGKMGEVLAFARVGIDTLTKGREAFLKIFDASVLDAAADELKKLEASILALAKNEGRAEKVESGAQETANKVTKMRDTYLGGKWNEASEVLEWMGFYTGAALVHWYLLSGAGKAHGPAQLEELSTEALRFYTSLFAQDEKLLAKIGASESEE